MQKTIVALAVAGMLGAASWVQAGGGCCPYSKSKDTAKDSAKVTTASLEGSSEKQGCGNKDWMTKNLDLSAEQQQQIAELKKSCDANACSVTGMKDYVAGIQKILTAEQMSKCQSICEEAGWECPMTTADKAADATSEKVES